MASLELAEERIKYSDEDLLNATFIMINALSNRMFDLCERESISEVDCLDMVESMGTEFRKLIKTYTNFDTTIK